MDKDVLDLLQDDLKNMIEQRMSVEVGSEEYLNLTHAIQVQSDAITKAMKELDDAKEKESRLKLDTESRTNDLEAKKEQFESEKSSREEELRIQREKLEEDKRMHEEELKLKQAQLEEEIRKNKEEVQAKLDTERKRAFQVIGAAGVTAIGSIAVVLLKIKHENYWIPELQWFEKENNFTFTAAREKVKSVFH